MEKGIDNAFAKSSLRDSRPTGERSGKAEKSEIEVNNNEWSEVPFYKILVEESISYGIVQPGPETNKPDSVPVIRVTNISDGRIDATNVKRVAKSVEEKYKRTRLEGGELLITVVGTVGDCAIVPKELKGFNVARAVSVARKKNEYDIEFVKYSFKTEDVIYQIYGKTNDTVQPTLNLSSLKSLKLSFPPLPEQKAIANVLSSLDTKIDLLHRQNKTLEELSEVLYRKWFIEEAKESWEDVPLKEMCQIRNGYAFKSDSYQSSGETIIRTTNFQDHFIELNNLKFISPELAKDYEKYRLNRNEFLLVMVGASLGNYSIVTDDVLPALQNQNMWAFISKEKKYQHYLNQTLKYIIKENINTASGSARSFFQKGAFYEILITKPDSETVIEKDNEFESMFSKIELNRKELKNLEKLRDTLLPKLMSGEVRVKQ